MITRHQPEHLRARARLGGTPRSHLLSAQVFGGVLIRERKRSDRASRPFGLLLLGQSGGAGVDSVSSWSAAIDALTAAMRDTDIAGWVEWQSLVGAIVPDLDPTDLPGACQRLEARYHRELARRLHPDAARRFSTRLHVYPEPRAEVGGQRPLDPLFYPDLGRRPAQRTSYSAIKRALDVAGSLTLLAVLSPLLLLIAVLVKMGSRGAVLFRQVRIGQMMTPFTMLKFRTMYSEADHRIHHEFVSSFIKAGTNAHEPSPNALFKLVEDPRVTPVGRLLRKTSLDELPQLWNVLRGEMSLVGPRPPIPFELGQYEPWHRRRVLEAKPGITGLWQVAGRSRTTFDEMVRMDLRYARTRSFWTDIKILLATPAAVISGKGAR